MRSIDFRLGISAFCEVSMGGRPENYRQFKLTKIDSEIYYNIVVSMFFPIIPIYAPLTIPIFTPCNACSASAFQITLLHLIAQGS